MNYHDTKEITEAINLIRVARTASDGGNYLHDAAVRLQFVMDCGSTPEARRLATSIAEAFDMILLIEELRNEAAA
jgi:hypothetical protein